ncbi:hypothetical protein Aca07nite_32210 [Actinoplanes capillaceus]|uniref:Signal peptidase I n=2 Tax=Actinoplanes campanulatus TaxID=113559 RepID=A0ABQ3WI54_9ACTN|nr:hypothetical protein GCM10010109_12460 [Actinoplanes campanulatus]GID35198.1 hypothetical protein Aca09nite_17040 [Actinoplanes campanulatus]GID45946.1 hypothetical protein Aca07nite_32210 [Actinoplanes capillaceus]
MGRGLPLGRLHPRRPEPRARRLPQDPRRGARRMSEIYVGNADPDALADRGWLLGHFKPEGDPRHSTDVEIKWGRHPRGDRRAEWVRGEERTALLVLISGCFHMEFPERTVVLDKQGDYVVWPRGVDHSWFAAEESVVLTVRWPSVPGYAVR